ncbi:MAG: carbohydrate kinase family protein [Clostridia bacterium]|jgi:ribokinase|nr:carbohydrate kinase family protein [Clostridia bacterium]
MDCIIFGGLVLDRYFDIEKYPERGQDGFINSEEEFVGGCAINMAATVNNIGGKAHIVSSVGNDKVGDTIIDYIKKHGFSEKYIKRVDKPSEYCFVFIEPDGERTFLTKKGAGVFDKGFVTDLDNIGAAAVTGYYLLNENADEIMNCIEKVSKKGIKILFDPSPLAGDIKKELLERMIKVSTVVTPNETEIHYFSEDTSKWIKDFINNGGTVFLKKGSKGGTVYTPESTFDYKSVKAKAVDTTGAGDSFAGALTYCMANGIDIKTASQMASVCAAKTVEIKGPHGFWRL